MHNRVRPPTGRRRAGHAVGAAETGPGATRVGGRAERRRAARRIKRRRRRSAIQEVPILVGVALLIALLLKTFLVQAFVIPSGSMENTIQISDRVLVNKFSPWIGWQPHHGDVVVFKDPGGWLDGEPPPAPDPPVIKQIKEFLTFIGLLPSSEEQDLIKRVIGLPGDTVACCDRQGRVTVNGVPLNEPYIAPGNPPSMIRFSVKVPPGRLWVMGDHRSDSADSRYHMNQPGGGTFPESLVVGRAFVIVWPVSHWATLPVPSTFASVPPATGSGGSASASVSGESAGRVDMTNNRQGMVPVPTPAELPLVIAVVGLRRWRGRRERGVRSGCGGRGRGGSEPERVP